MVFVQERDVLQVNTPSPRANSEKGEMDIDKRVVVGLARSQVLYLGTRWYRQGEVDCIPLSIINGSQAIGATVHPHTQYLLRAYAAIDNIHKDSGMYYIEAKKIMDRQKHQNIAIWNVKNSDQLRQIPIKYQALHKKVAKGSTVFKDLVIHNARVIEEYIESGFSLLTSIISSNYDTKKGKGHAITITGFIVDSQGFMHVQIIDSFIGIHLLPIEKLSSVIFNKETFKLGRTLRR